MIQEGLMAAVVTIVIIPVIVKGLSKMVPWEKYGCEVVGTVEDGLEGLELIRQLRRTSSYPTSICQKWMVLRWQPR